MQTLQEVQKGFDSMGFSPKLKPFNYRVLSIVVQNFLGVISLWIFLVHDADGAQEYMESIYVVTVSTGVFLSFASTIFIRDELFSYIRGIDEFANERMENPTSKEICENANKFIAKWSKIGFFVMKYMVVSCVILPKAIFSFFIYFSTDLQNDAFDLPLPMWFPFSWKNPIGYLVTVFIQFWLVMLPLQYFGCFSFLAFGAFMFAKAFVKILKNKLHSINKMARHKKSQKNMYKKLSKFIRIHADLKQLFILFTDIYEMILIITFAFVIIAICASMLLIQIEISHNESDSFVLLEATIFGACAIIELYFICELGQRFSDAIDEIGDTTITLNWYLYPSEIQRLLPTIMQCAQKPVVIKCFGNILCAREQFKKVVKIVYSYFMVLRKFFQ